MCHIKGNGERRGKSVILGRQFNKGYLRSWSLKAVQEWALRTSKGKSTLGGGRKKYRYSRESTADSVALAEQASGENAKKLIKEVGGK